MLKNCSFPTLSPETTKELGGDELAFTIAFDWNGRATIALGPGSRDAGTPGQPLNLKASALVDLTAVSTCLFQDNPTYYVIIVNGQRILVQKP